jgi:hypothetical protein
MMTTNIKIIFKEEATCRLQRGSPKEYNNNQMYCRLWRLPPRLWPPVRRSPKSWFSGGHFCNEDVEPFRPMLSERSCLPWMGTFAETAIVDYRWTTKETKLPFAAKKRKIDLSIFRLEQRNGIRHFPLVPVSVKVAQQKWRFKERVSRILRLIERIYIQKVSFLHYHMDLLNLISQRWLKTDVLFMWVL